MKASGLNLMRMQDRSARHQSHTNIARRKEDVFCYIGTHPSQTIIKNLEVIRDIFIKAFEINPADRDAVKDIVLNQKLEHAELSLGMLNTVGDLEKQGD